MTAHIRENSTALDGVSVAEFTELERAKDFAAYSSAPVNKSSIYTNIGKRVLDTVLVLASAPLVLLVLAPFLIAIARDGGRPFYSQMRVGKNGKSYRMWKLRTMVHDADSKLSEYLAENAAAKAEWDLNQKLKNDPRITRTGRILRKTSLDELPQLWNVLIGEMSIVGPRPMMEGQRDLYVGDDYYDLLPGITGPWQVSARNESSFAERAHFDAQYNRTMSVMTDAKLIVATVGVVFKATGH